MNKQHSNTTINLLIILSVILVIGLGISQYQIFNLNENLLGTQQEINEKLVDINSNLGSLKQTDEILTNAIDDQGEYFNTKLGESASEITSVRQQLSEAEQRLGEQIENVQIQNQDFVGVINAVIDSVVIVRTDKAIGSGVFVDSNKIITNEHVVRDASVIQIETYSGEKIWANLIGISSEDDLALLEINGSFDYLKFANSDNVQTGEKVIALGSPKGLQFTVTEGIVSNPKQNVNGKLFVQHSVAINAGNSGGPLVNLKKEIVGINTFKLSNSEGLGFAIRGDTVRNFINDLE